jgi:hypothetical protein
MQSLEEALKRKPLGVAMPHSRDIAMQALDEALKLEMIALYKIAFEDPADRRENWQRRGGGQTQFSRAAQDLKMWHDMATSIIEAVFPK